MRTGNDTPQANNRAGRRMMEKNLRSVGGKTHLCKGFSLLAKPQRIGPRRKHHARQTRN